MRKSGYSLLEVLAVLALLCILTIAIIPHLGQFREGSQRGVGLRNMTLLNSAVQQYDQSGGLLTANVPVASNVEDVVDRQELPEMQVLSYLREGRSGTVSAWQEPIFSTEGYRVIWVNPTSEQGAVRIARGGVRNDAAEELVKSGNGGRFELIGPLELPGRQGIVGFQRGDLVLGSEQLEPSSSPQPPQVNRPPKVTITALPASGLLGQTFTYVANGEDPDGDNLYFSFSHAGVRTPMGEDRVYTRSFASSGSYTVSVTVSDGELEAQAQATVSVFAGNGQPVVELRADVSQPHRGQAVTFTASASDENGDELRYRFLQDGAIVQEGQSNTFVTSYADLGAKSVTVQASDPGQLTASDTCEVEVVNRAPEVSLRASGTRILRGGLATFSATGLDRDGDDLVYNFELGGSWIGFGNDSLLTAALPDSNSVVKVQARDSWGALSNIAEVSMLTYTPGMSVPTPPIIAPTLGTTPGTLAPTTSRPINLERTRQSGKIDRSVMTLHNGQILGGMATDGTIKNRRLAAKLAKTVGQEVNFTRKINGRLLTFSYPAGSKNVRKWTAKGVERDTKNRSMTKIVERPAKGERTTTKTTTNKKTGVVKETVVEKSGKTRTKTVTVTDTKTGATTVTTKTKGGGGGAKKK